MSLDLANIAALAAQGCVVRVLPDGSVEVSASATGPKVGGTLVPEDRTAPGMREGCGDAATLDAPGSESPAPCGDSAATSPCILTPKQKRAARNKRYRTRLKTALETGTATASQRGRVSAAAARRALRRVEGVPAIARSASLPAESVSAPARNVLPFAGGVLAAAQSVSSSAESASAAAQGVSPLAESVSSAAQSVSPVGKTAAAPRPLPLSPQTPLSPAPTPGHTHVPVPAYEAGALPDEAAAAAPCSTAASTASTASAAEASDSAGETAMENTNANANANTNATANASADSSTGTKANAETDTGLKAKTNASDDTAAAGETFALQHPDPAEVTGRRRRKAKTNAPKEPKAPKPVAADDEQWLKSLAENAGYAGLNIPMELARMQAWCELRQKQPTRRRFLNWLNHAVGDRVMTAPSTPGPGTPLSPSTYPYASHRLPPRHRSDSANRPGRYASAPPTVAEVVAAAAARAASAGGGVAVAV